MNRIHSTPMLATIEMKNLLTIILAFTLLECNSLDIKGNWQVVGTSGDSISVIGYGDLKFKPGYEIIFEENQMKVISENSKVLEEYNYEFSKDVLTIIYSDFGIPITVESNDENEVYLYGGGWGNSMEEQRKSYFLMVLKKN